MSRILIVGGDMRNVCLSRMLFEKGSDVGVCGINADVFAPGEARVYGSPAECVPGAELIILPLICSADGITINTPLYDGCVYLKDICKYAGKDALICGGKINPSVFEDHGLRAVDYACRDDFASLNAVPTAEGAVEAAMKLLPVTIFSSEAAVTGFGKCAKVLTLTLRAMGAKVTVFARSQRDLALARAFGMESFPLDKMYTVLNRSDVIFNTIPCAVFGDRELSAIRKDVPLIDIASSPGGTERELVRKHGVRYEFLPGLPGKYSPVTAAEIIMRTVMNIIGESGKDASTWIYGEQG